MNNKINKKFYCFIAVILAVTNIFTVSVFASSPVIEGERSLYSYDFESGKTFTVNFMLNSNPGINNATFRVKYNPDVIQAVENDNTDTDGFVKYYISETNQPVLISNNIINRQINVVPDSSNNDYDKLGDSKKTASEIGIIKIAALANGSGIYKGAENDGILFQMKFKLVGTGNTDIQILNAYKSKSMFNMDDKGIENLQINSIKVAVNEKSGNDSSSDNSSSGGGGGGGTSKPKPETTTNAEESTEETTEQKTETTTNENISDENNNIKTFNDVLPDHWASKAVNFLASKGIINGMGDGTFKPDYKVKRADFIIMLMSAMGFEGKPESNFADVPKDKYYADAVGLAKDLNIASGNGNNLFNPEDEISRQDMMVLASRAMELKAELKEADISVLDRFNDRDSIFPYAEKSLAAMVDLGIVNGMGESLQPKSDTTRAQAAVIIYNIYMAVNK